MRKVVLFSGGIDSTTLLWSERREHTVLALAFDYGQPHKIELEYARNLADLADVPFRIMTLPPLQAQGAVFPARNTIFIAVAIGIALQQGYEAVAFGPHRDDADMFPDCRPLYVAAMREVIRRGYPNGPSLETPFLDWSKKEIVAEARALEVPLYLTWSCYGEGPKPCETCSACQLRRLALA